MNRRLLLAQVACVLLAGGGGTGYHLTSSDAPDPQSSQTHAALGSSPADSPSITSMVLGRTTDGEGQSHDLVLHAAGLQQARQQGQLFAVLTGTTFSVSGDAVVDDWRFTVNRSAPGDPSPIVVLKFRHGTMADLARDPGKFAYPTTFNDDALRASVRLSDLIDSILSRSKLPQGLLYQRLAAILTDPDWNGVLVFHASVPAMPSTVLGLPTGALAGTHVPALALAFPAAPPSAGSKPPDSFFAILDHSWTAPKDAPTTATHHLRALFVNSKLASFEMSQD